MIKIAKAYRDKYKFSIIPLKPDKKPLVKWEEYQKRYATDEEIERWWTKYPECIIGVVTGKLSGIAVVDFDTKEIDSDLISGATTPLVETPRGYHYYFKYEDGITNTARIGGQKIDVRGEGGYVVVPPSKNDKGQKYEWLVSFNQAKPQKFPLEIFSETGKAFQKVNLYEGTGKNYFKDEVTKLTFNEGTRDETLFHIACNLVRSGMAEAEIREVISQLAKTCVPPFSDKEAQLKVDSALKRGDKIVKRWDSEVTEWVQFTTGYFPNTACYQDLGAVSTVDKSAIRVTLKRLKDRGVIEPHPTQNGCYRLIQSDLEELDWKHAPTEEIPLKFPLNIEDYVKIYPKSIIMVAGKSDAGKTAFLLEFAKLNMDKHEIHFFINEAGETELAVRLGLFKGMKKEDWKCFFWDRDASFADVIKPNAINIIDYLDVTEDFAYIGTPIREVHNKLNKGIALIAIQKNPKRYDFKTSQYIDTDLGVGGAKSIGKSRLYLAIDDGQVKIVKAKNRRERESPNGMTRQFEIYDGHDFSPRGFWKKPWENKE